METDALTALTIADPLWVDISDKTDLFEKIWRLQHSTWARGMSIGQYRDFSISTFRDVPKCTQLAIIRGVTAASGLPAQIDANASVLASLRYYRHQTWVKQGDGQIREYDNSLVLSGVLVEPKLRGKGAGSKGLECFMKLMLKQDAPPFIYLWSGAGHWYKRFGFRYFEDYATRYEPLGDAGSSANVYERLELAMTTESLQDHRDLMHSMQVKLFTAEEAGAVLSPIVELDNLAIRQEMQPGDHVFVNDDFCYAKLASLYRTQAYGYPLRYMGAIFEGDYEDSDKYECKPFIVWTHDPAFDVLNISRFRHNCSPTAYDALLRAARLEAGLYGYTAVQLFDVKTDLRQPELIDIDFLRRTEGFMSHELRSDKQVALFVPESLEGDWKLREYYAFS